jgi:ubiquinone biosynthesis protein UbiJ
MLLSLVQRMLNEQIRASTAARERIDALEGKCFAVRIKSTDLRYVATACSGELKLARSADGAANVELTAGLFDLLRLAKSSSLGDLRDVGASLDGEIGVAEGFADLMRFAVPEPEAWLADWIGDMPAHAVGQATRRASAWAEQAEHAFEQNLGEYLQEERPTLVPPPLARRFSDEVDRVRDDVDRAERRIELLERKTGRRTDRG